MDDVITTSPMDRDGEFVPVQRIERPEDLCPGNQLVRMADLYVVTLLRRKDPAETFPGWWLAANQGGLMDAVIVREYRLIPAEPKPERLARGVLR